MPYEHCVFYQQVNNNFVIIVVAVGKTFSFIQLHYSPWCNLGAVEVRIHQWQPWDHSTGYWTQDQIHHAQAPISLFQRPTLTLLSCSSISKTQDLPQWLWSQGCTVGPINVPWLPAKMLDMKIVPYCVVGLLMYAALGTYPDISFMVTILSQYTKPGETPLGNHHVINASYLWGQHCNEATLLKVHSDGWAERDIDFVGTLTQWLSSVYSNQWLGTWDGTLPDAAVILRDQAEECLLHQMNYIVTHSNIPEQSYTVALGVWIRHWDQPAGSAMITLGW